MFGPVAILDTANITVTVSSANTDDTHIRDYSSLFVYLQSSSLNVSASDPIFGFNHLQLCFDINVNPNSLLKFAEFHEIA